MQQTLDRPLIKPSPDWLTEVHAGNGDQRGSDAGVHRCQRRRRKPGGQRVDPNHQDVASIEAGIQGSKVAESAHEQHGAGQEHQRHRHLRHHEHPAGTAGGRNRDVSAIRDGRLDAEAIGSMPNSNPVATASVAVNISSRASTDVASVGMATWLPSNGSSASVAQTAASIRRRRPRTPAPGSR